MATYSSTLADPLVAQLQPLDMGFDDFIGAAAFDPAYADLFETTPQHGQLPHDQHPYLHHPAGDADPFLFPLGTSKVPLASYVQLPPSAPHSPRSSGTTSPSQRSPCADAALDALAAAAWAGSDVVHDKQQHLLLHPLDTAFDLLQYPHGLGPPYHPMLASEKAGFSVDPSLIQQLPTPHSSATSPLAVARGFPSGEPSLSPSGSHSSGYAAAPIAYPPPPPPPHQHPHPQPQPPPPQQQQQQQQQQPPSLYSASPDSGPPPAGTHSRKPSVHSLRSVRSHGSGTPLSPLVDDEGRDRSVCPYPDCGKTFKDLKAHMLTHQNERPEKCPIASCDFHRRGFARKYDRNRHLVTTHYRATVVCGFCPGQGSPSETTFNRPDVFKRHLVSEHGVDQNGPSSKRRSGRRGAPGSPTSNDGVGGACTTCGGLFPNAQELFDHLDDCILRVVTQADPSEAANERNLRSVAEDDVVRATMKRHSLPSQPPPPVVAPGSRGPSSATSTCDGEDDDGDNDDDDNDDNDDDDRGGDDAGPRPSKVRRLGGGDGLAIVHDSHTARAGGPAQSRRVAPGLTYSRGGVDLAVSRGRRRRKHYPQSWGCGMDDMTLKKRVLCVFDGPRRLAKDDMMLGGEFVRRVELSEGGWVTNLDVETIRRAEGFHSATEEERGPWMPTNYPSAAAAAVSSQQEVFG